MYILILGGGRPRERNQTAQKNKNNSKGGGVDSMHMAERSSSVNFLALMESSVNPVLLSLCQGQCTAGLLPYSQVFPAQ